MSQIINSKWLNIAFFNLSWLACVVGRDEFLWLTVPIIAVYLVLLLTTHAVTLFQLILPAGLGITLDAILTFAGVFNFSNFGWPIPVWLMLLWLVFATTLPLSLAFLVKFKAILVLAGAIGFPFSYAMGERLGAVTFGLGYVEALVLLFFIWGFMLPVMFYFVIRAKGS